jgi:hypothetical protein
LSAEIVAVARLTDLKSKGPSLLTRRSGNPFTILGVAPEFDPFNESPCREVLPVELAGIALRRAFAATTRDSCDAILWTRRGGFNVGASWTDTPIPLCLVADPTVVEVEVRPFTGWTCCSIRNPFNIRVATVVRLAFWRENDVREPDENRRSKAWTRVAKNVRGATWIVVWVFARLIRRRIEFRADDRTERDFRLNRVDVALGVLVNQPIHPVKDRHVWEVNSLPRKTRDRDDLISRGIAVAEREVVEAWAARIAVLVRPRVGLEEFDRTLVVR